LGACSPPLGCPRVEDTEVVLTSALRNVNHGCCCSAYYRGTAIHLTWISRPKQLVGDGRDPGSSVIDLRPHMREISRIEVVTVP